MLQDLQAFPYSGEHHGKRVALHGVWLEDMIPEGVIDLPTWVHGGF